MKQCSGLLVLGACAALGSAAALGADNVDQRIDGVRNALLPPVLIQGETPQTTKLADRMAALHVPGISIAVFHGGKIQWARGFGVTRLGGPPVDARTLFQAASISKPVTALAVMRLVQSGKLDLDADANRYLKHWKIPANEFTARHAVTLRELLTHTAGMTVHGFPGYAAGTALPTLTQVLDGKPPANSQPIRVDLVPGTQWRYSGGGYVVVQQLLEDVTGTAFAKYMQDTVLTPIGMRDSTYEQPLPAHRAHDVALPYRQDGAAVQGGPHVYPERTAAGLWTTPSDLARYAIEVQRDLSGETHGILSAATVRAMLTPGMNHQGLGPQVGGSPSLPYFEHSGANEGYQCDLVAYESGDGVAIMTNGDNGGALIAEILRTIAHEYGWPDFQPPVRTLAKLDPRLFDSRTGSYRIAPDFVMTFTREGDHLMSQGTGQGQVEIFPESDHEYFTKVVNARITFQTDAHGRATAMVLHQGGRDIPGQRVDDATGKAIAADLALANQRFHTQAPAPGSEAALRKFVQALATDKPLDGIATPAFAAIVHQQQAYMHQTLVGQGDLTRVAFKSVAPNGAAIYHFTWTHGAADLGVTLSGDGKVAAVTFQPTE